MKKILRRRFFGPQSDNRKSKTCPEPSRRIQNLKWVGIFAIVLALTMCGTRAEAQPPGKMFRIGFLDNSTASGSAVLLEAFRQELRKFGWIEGKNIAIEYRFAEQKLERLPELAADLVHLKVDLIVVTVAPPALAAKKATTTIPIVMTNVPDPVGADLVASLARPGGNVSGLASLSAELNSKRLDTQGRGSQARSSWNSAAGTVSQRPSTERAQACGAGTRAKIGGDRDATRLQKLRECLSNRKAKAG
jgi:hypothetical protein